MSKDLLEIEEIKRPYIGKFYIHGKGVKNSVIGLKQLNESMEGILDIIKFYSNYKNTGKTRNRIVKNLDIPVVIKKGSINILILETALWGFKVFLGSYIAEKTKILVNKGLKASFKNYPPFFKEKDRENEKALYKIIIVVKAAKFVGGIGETACDENNITVKVSEDGIYLLKRGTDEKILISRDEYDIFVKTPPTLFKKLCSVVQSNIDLTIESINSEGVKKFTIVTEKEKGAFCDDENKEIDEILPELIDKSDVSLKGSITRASDSTNSIGFEYKDHIITCYPRSQNISDFSDVLINVDKNGGSIFQKSVLMTGVVDRKSTRTGYKHFRPNIIFDNIELIKNDILL